MAVRGRRVRDDFSGRQPASYLGDYPGGGPAQVEMDSVNAGGALANGGGRYVTELPGGMIAGPHVGAHRIRM
ncbi:MAG: hypothetical protein WAK04_12460 [Xanthobacteraceae bacterium]